MWHCVCRLQDSCDRFGTFQDAIIDWKIVTIIEAFRKKERKKWQRVKYKKKDEL